MLCTTGSAGIAAGLAPRIGEAAAAAAETTWGEGKTRERVNICNYAF